MGRLGKFSRLATLRSLNEVFIGRPRMVFAAQDAIILLYPGKCFVAVNFGDVTRQVRKLGLLIGWLESEVRFSVNSVEEGGRVANRNVTLPPHSIMVAQTVNTT